VGVIKKYSERCRQMERNMFLKLNLLVGGNLDGSVFNVIFFSDEMDFGLIKAKTIFT
jgi:hypothetical protein